MTLGLRYAWGLTETESGFWMKQGPAEAGAGAATELDCATGCAETVVIGDKPGVLSGLGPSKQLCNTEHLASSVSHMYMTQRNEWDVHCMQYLVCKAQLCP